MYMGSLPALCYPVLIDTWWNVNSFEPQIITMRKRVLIDTWWNVNR